MNTNFTNKWFQIRALPIWERILPALKDKEIHAIEIGCYEGQASCWLLDNVLLHPKSELICVDIFSSEQELKNEPWKEVKQRFLDNTAQYGDKVILIEQRSDKYLRQRVEKADLIYIDGSHLAADVLTDGVLANQLLNPEGILIFDDYLWDNLVKAPQLPRPAIDAFMECFALQYDLVTIGYQAILKKK